VTAVLITGMSGTGKSTLLAELARRGHRVVDTDDPGWLEVVEGEPLWRTDRITALLDEHTAGTLFVSGCVANQGRFSDRFAAVVLLSVPENVLLGRLADRRTNDFGKTAAERARILADLREVEPLLRAGATAEIDTRAPVEAVADRLEALAAASRPAP
jgi:adenylate kinase family enzyme